MGAKIETVLDQTGRLPERKSVSWRIGLAAFAVLCLSACASTDKEASLKPDDAKAANVEGAADAKVETDSAQGKADKQVAAVAGAQQVPLSDPPDNTTATAYDQAPAAAGEAQSVVMQANGLNATSTSIFSSRPVAVGDTVATTGTTPNSLYKPAPAEQAQPGELPLKPLEGADAGKGKADMQKQASIETKAPSETAGDTDGADKATDAADATLVAAGLFRTKRRPGFEKDRFAGAKPRRTITGAQSRDTASLAYNALPGVSLNPLFAMSAEAEFHDADAGPPVEVASLSGLARLAPNGLMLQTATVETGCFKPQLLGVLKTIESHYGKKLVVTSGFRPQRLNASVGGRRMSRHMTCEAADIQIEGVSKWALADYLRSLPGRGGVGTYCHTESVHVDIGPARDWNWRCRRRRG